MKYASYIDHTLLKADASSLEIKKLCKEALKYEFFSVCVNPDNIKLCKKYLTGSSVKVCSVVGFPLGSNDPKTKLFEAKKAIKDGADEIDVVINVARLKDKKYKYVEKELASIVKISRGKAIVKAIIETCLLTKEEIKVACEIVYSSGVDYVKTSTGFSKYGARVEDVELIKEICKDKIKIKASGGIGDFETMKSLIGAGASRIGTSHGVEIMEEIVKKSAKEGEM
jgi:deoxyribose-phosphate aldolase